MPFLRSAAVACAMMIGSLALAARAEAVTINTYSFTQDGYLTNNNAVDGFTGSISGSFSATVGSSGIIGQADLTDFSFTFDMHDPYVTDDIRYTGDASDLAGFSYNPTGTASTLFILTDKYVQDFGARVRICIGAPAALGLCGGSGGSKGAFIFVSLMGTITPGDGHQPLLATSAVPQIALTSVATTPIPPALPLFASAVGALGLLRWRKARPHPLPAA